MTVTGQQATTNNNSITSKVESDNPLTSRVYNGYRVSLNQTYQTDCEALVIECKREHLYDSRRVEHLKVTIPTNFSLAMQSAFPYALVDVYTESNIDEFPEANKFYISIDCTNSTNPTLDLSKIVDKLVEIFSQEGFYELHEPEQNKDLQALKVNHYISRGCPIIKEFVDQLRSESEKLSQQKAFNHNHTASLNPSFKISSNLMPEHYDSVFVNIRLNTFPRNIVHVGFEFKKPFECVFLPNDYRLYRVSLYLYSSNLSNFRYIASERQFERAITLQDICSQNRIFSNFLEKMIRFEGAKTSSCLPLNLLNDSFAVCNLRPANLYTILRGPRFIN